MPTHYCSTLPLSILFFIAGQSQAQDANSSAAAPGPIESVVVLATKNDTRQLATASRVVIGHADIVKYGDSNLSDVLRRLPGITVDGGIRMRGLGNGYTQILVNGEPVAPGFSIDALAPDLIERVEILRTAVAKYSTQSIAGTINIVLKKGVARAERSLKAAVAKDRAGYAPNLSLQLSDRSDDISYTLPAVARRERYNTPSASTIISSAANGQFGKRMAENHFQAVVDTVSFAPRLGWRDGHGDELAWQNFIETVQQSVQAGTRETTYSGDASQYPNNDWHSRARINSGRSDLTWLHRFADNGRFNLKAGLNRNKRSTHYGFLGFDDDDHLTGDRRVDSQAVDNAYYTSGKWSSPFMPGHSLALGWDANRSRRGEFRFQTDLLPAGAEPGTLYEDYEAIVTRTALFVQDEWDLTDRLQAYVGVRWEGLRTDSVSNIATPVHRNSSVWSPVFQTVWKLPGSAKDQLRLGLTRTYKAPSTPSLIPRRYTANNDNGPTNPDRQGNPDLRPELAWGIDTAYEHYFGKGSLASVSAFARRIDGVLMQWLYQNNGVWITTPINNGKADVAGVEMELAAPLSTWLADAPPVDLKANFSRNWSRVAAVHRSNNRLGEQPRLSANLGLEYHARNTLTLGANLNWKSGGDISVSDLLTTSTGIARTLDIYGLWKMDKVTNMRLSANNILCQDTSEGIRYADTSLGSDRATRSAARCGARIDLERKF